MRVGIAHHLGWAVAITSSGPDGFLDRRRIELVDPELPAAPVHHVGGPHALHATGEPVEDAALAALVARVRASAEQAAAAALEDLATSVPEPIRSLSVVAWPADFPDDIAVFRRVPYESRADSVMYRQVLADAAGERGWDVLTYDAKTIEARAAEVLGDRADEILRRPRAVLGPPWTKDHRTAYAATIVAR